MQSNDIALEDVELHQQQQSSRKAITNKLMDDTMMYICICITSMVSVVINTHTGSMYDLTRT